MFSFRLTLLGVLLVCSGALAQEILVYPYLQNLDSDSVEIYLVSRRREPYRLLLGKARVRSTVEPAPTLVYNAAETEDEPDLAEFNRRPPYLHRFRLEGLKAGTRYSYRLEGDDFSAAFTTRDPKAEKVRLIAYADSETEPESTGKASKWPTTGQPERLYLLDQTTGYRENLRVIRERQPDAILIAGDLVESGGEQRDWDEFWRHNSHPDNASTAAHFEVLPAVGNHEYYGGPRSGHYELPASRAATGKYFTYFHPRGWGHRAHYYSKKIGPVRVISVDSCDGLPNRSDSDSNFYFKAAPDLAPGINPGSAQYAWLENELSAAQEEDAFTFVFFHHCPYSSGPHGFKPGTNKEKGEDPQSGRPLRVWTPLFLKYGVDAVLCGHDEMFERSAVRGHEVTYPNGERRDHVVHFYDVGVGGDGLRAARLDNPLRQWLAEVDAPEQWVDGVLVDGGRHYGHLEIDVSREGDGWKAVLSPVYVFPVTTDEGFRFERRVYDDVVVLKSSAR